MTSFSSPKTKIPLSSNKSSSNENNISTNINTNKFKNYKEAANLLSIKSTNNKTNKKSEIEEENINQNETLSNIIDAINENNLNEFYEDDTSNFKRNIDQLNLKFYLETEKIIKCSNNNNEVSFNSNKLFLILFKQINLYIQEIERLNVIILNSKCDPHSISKKLSVINRQKSDFEVKEQIIKTLKFSITSLEKQLANVLNSENLLRQENKKLEEEKQFYLNFYMKYKENNIKDNPKIIINNKINREMNTSNDYIFKYNANTSNNNIIITNSYNYQNKKEENKKIEDMNNNSNKKEKKKKMELLKKMN